MLVGGGYYRLGAYDQAVAAFRKAIALHRTSCVTSTAAGPGPAKKKDWDGAIAAFREAVRLEARQRRMGHVGLGEP